jgi:hypothetical protein
MPSRHFILIRPAGASSGGHVIEYTSGDIAETYSIRDAEALATGDTITRGKDCHTDLVAHFDATQRSGLAASDAEIRDIFARAQ